MALQIQYEDAHGVVHSQAYARVNTYRVRREVGHPVQVEYLAEVYAENAARVNRKLPVGYVEGAMEYADTGPLRLSDIYAHAKTLPEFAGALDV